MSDERGVEVATRETVNTAETGGMSDPVSHALEGTATGAVEAAAAVTFPHSLEGTAEASGDLA